MVTRFKIMSTSITLLLIVVFSVAPARAGCVMKFGGPEKSMPLMSFEEVNHADFHVMLRHYVDDRGRVCYDEWADHRCDVNRLQTYLHHLTQVDPSRPSSREATLAYYINAYNALTLWGILDNYPVVSIQKLDGENSRYDIFDDLQLWIGDRYLSLNGIENDALRPMGDPRIHFALVCAARGCPRLRNEAYTAQCVDRQLTDNAIEFFSDRNRFHIVRLTGKVKISPILKWYREDFGQTDYQVVSTVFPYLPAEDRCWLATNQGWKLTHLGYDWGLNDGCPAISVALGRVPYRAYSKVSPMIAPLLLSSDGNSSNSGTSSQDSSTQPAPVSAYAEPPLHSAPPVIPIEPPIPGDELSLPVPKP